MHVGAMAELQLAKTALPVVYRQHLHILIDTWICMYTFIYVHEVCHSVGRNSRELQLLP